MSDKPGHLQDPPAGADVELSGTSSTGSGTEINPADNVDAAPPALGDKRLRRC